MYGAGNSIPESRISPLSTETKNMPAREPLGEPRSATAKYLPSGDQLMPPPNAAG